MSRVSKVLHDLGQKSHIYPEIVRNANGRSIADFPASWTGDDIDHIRANTPGWWQRAIDSSGNANKDTVAKWALADSSAISWIAGAASPNGFKNEASIKQALNWLPELLATGHPILTSRHYPAAQHFAALRPFIAMDQPESTARRASLVRSYVAGVLADRHAARKGAVKDRKLIDDTIPNPATQEAIEDCKYYFTTSVRRMIWASHESGAAWSKMRYAQDDLRGLRGGVLGDAAVPRVPLGEIPLHFLTGTNMPFQDSPASQAVEAANWERTKAFIEDGEWIGIHGDYTEEKDVFDETELVMKSVVVRTGKEEEHGKVYIGLEQTVEHVGGHETRLSMYGSIIKSSGNIGVTDPDDYKY